MDIDDNEIDAFLNKTGGAESAPVQPHPFDLSSAISATAQKHNIPEPLLKAQLNQESRGKVNAKSSAGAMGLMQLMPATAKELGVKNILDPQENLEGGATYLEQMHNQFGDWDKALAAYNAGPGRVQKAGGIPRIPETQNYVKTINDSMNKDIDQDPDLNAFLNKDFSKPQASPMTPEKLEALDKNSQLEPDEIDHWYPTPGDIGAAGKSWLRGVTANLSEPISSLLAAPIAHTIIQHDPNLKYSQNESVKDIYNRMQEMGQEDVAKTQKEHPLSSMVGNIGGILTPYGAFSRINKAVGGLIPAYSELAQIGGGLAPEVEGSSALAKLLTEAPRQALTGGTSNYLYNAINPEAEAKPKDFLEGAALGAATVPLEAGGEALYNAFKPNAERMRTMLETVIPSEWTSNLRANRAAAEAKAEKAFEASENSRKVLNRMTNEDRIASALEAKEEATHNLGKLRTTPEEAADKLKKATEAKNIELGQEYKSIVNPAMKQFGGDITPAEGLKNHLNELLGEKGYLDENGNVLDVKIANREAPKLKDFYSTLSRFSKKLQGNLTINDLKEAEEDLSSLANFEGGANRSAQEKIFAKLSRTAKDDVFNGLTEASGPESEVANKVKAMQAKYAQNRPLLDELVDFTSNRPQAMERLARTKLEPQFVNQLIKAQPNLREHLKDVVLNNLLSRGKNAKSLEEAIRQYGPENLHSLLGQETFESLMDAKDKFIGTSSTKPIKIPFIPGQMPEADIGKIYQFMSLLPRGIGKVAYGANKAMQFAGPQIAKDLKEGGQANIERKRRLRLQKEARQAANKSI